MDVKSLELRLKEFAEERGWVRFHCPKNLAIAVAAEAGELLHLFEWLSDEESLAAVKDERSERIREEVADVAIYLIQFCSAAKIDLEEAVRAKIEKNSTKYARLPTCDSDRRDSL